MDFKVNKNQLNSSTYRLKNKSNSQYIKNSKNNVDSFEKRTAKTRAKKRKSVAILAAVLTALSLNKCAKADNVYENIGAPNVELSSYSQEYFNDYSSSDELSLSALKGQKKADAYSNVPLVGSFLYGINGSQKIQDAVATEGNVVNGYIDENIAQGIISDCWLITPVENLSYTPKGAEIIHNAISVNENGNIDVYFKGPDLTYTVTLDEINKGNKEYSVYSRGDDDMLVLEIAAEKFRKDLLDGKIPVDESLPSYLYYTNTSGSNVLDIGETRQAYWMLAGITDSIEARTKDEISYVLAKYKANPDVSLLNVELNDTAKVKDINGKSCFIFGSHGYGVKDMTDDTITLASATHTDRDIVLSKEEFSKLPISCLIYCELP